MKKTITLLTLVLFIKMNAQVFTAKAPFPTAGKSRAVAFSIGNFGYYGSGNDFGGSAETNSFYKYDPALNTWTTVASMPSGMQAHLGFSMGDCGYVGIGWQGGGTRANLYRYDPVTNNWTSKANFTGTGVNDAAGYGLNGKAYVCVGSQAYAPAITQFYQYDSTANTWAAKPNFPGAARRAAVAISDGNYLYVGGGNSDPYTVSYNDFFKYSPLTNTWTAIASCPADASTQMSATRNSAFILCNQIYLCLKSEMWMYDIATDVWSQITGYPVTATVDGVFTINNKGYFIENNSNKFWEFSIPSPTVTVNSGTICAGQSFTIIPSGATTYTIQGGSAVVSPTVSTSYSVVGTNTAGCVSPSSAISNVTVLSCNSINELNAKNHIYISPNPNNGEFSISADTDIILTITNELGQIIKTIDTSKEKNNQISITNLPNGIYFISGNNGNYSIKQKIIVVN